MSRTPIASHIQINVFLFIIHFLWGVSMLSDFIVLSCHLQCWTTQTSDTWLRKLYARVHMFTFGSVYVVRGIFSGAIVLPSFSAESTTHRMAFNRYEQAPKPMLNVNEIWRQTCRRLNVPVASECIRLRIVEMHKTQPDFGEKANTKNVI